MKATLTRFSFALGSIGSIASAAIAGDVLVVSPTGPYTTIQSAIDAAADYDTILVRSQAGTYDAFVLQGRSLAVIGRGGTQPAIPEIVGESLVGSTPAGGFVILGRLHMRAGEYGENGLRVSNNTGSVWMEDSDARGKSAPWNGQGAGPAAEVQSSSDVQFVGGSIVGGSCEYAYPSSVSGARALLVFLSATRLVGCTITGGSGSTEPDTGEGFAGGWGGAGLIADGGVTLAIGATIRGGAGGAGGWDQGLFCPDYGGNGGSGGTGIVIGSSSSAAAADVRTRGGAISGGAAGAGGGSDCGNYGSPGQPGQPIVTVNGTWSQLTGVARTLTGNPSAHENTGAMLTAIGAPGDKVFLQIGGIAPPQSPAVVGAPSHLPVRPTKHPYGVYIGTIPASGTLETALPLGALPPNTDSQWLKLRPLFVDTNGGIFYGNSFVLIVLDHSI